MNRQAHSNFRENNKNVNVDIDTNTNQRTKAPRAGGFRASKIFARSWSIFKARRVIASEDRNIKLNTNSKDSSIPNSQVFSKRDANTSVRLESHFVRDSAVNANLNLVRSSGIISNAITNKNLQVPKSKAAYSNSNVSRNLRVPINRIVYVHVSIILKLSYGNFFIKTIY